MSSSWADALIEQKYMKWLHFIEVMHLSLKGKKWKKKEWFAAQDDLFFSAYGKDSRNEQRPEDELKILLKIKAKSWYERPDAFRLAVIDSQNRVESLQENTTYYMMGSLIRFGTETVKISYDNQNTKFYQQLNVPWDYASSYIKETFSPESLGELFFRAEVVAHLNFDVGGLGRLDVNQESIYENFNNFYPQSHIFASVIYKNDLPIQYAKPIGVSNVGLIS